MKLKILVLTICLSFLLSLFGDKSFGNQCSQLFVVAKKIEQRRYSIYIKSPDVVREVFEAIDKALPGTSVEIYTHNLKFDAFTSLLILKALEVNMTRKVGITFNFSGEVTSGFLAMLPKTPAFKVNRIVEESLENSTVVTAELAPRFQHSNYSRERYRSGQYDRAGIYVPQHKTIQIAAKNLEAEAFSSPVEYRERNTFLGRLQLLEKTPISLEDAGYRTESDIQMMSALANSYAKELYLRRFQKHAPRDLNTLEILSRVINS